MSEEIVLYEGRGGGWAWLLLAGFLGLGVIWGGHWWYNCYGSVGEIHYQDNWTPFFGSSPRLNHFDVLHGHTTGLMWLGEGEQVDIGYRANFAGKGNYADYWFGPVDEWLNNELFGKSGFYNTKGRMTLRQGAGSYTFQAPKSGFYIVHYLGGAVNGDFTLSWKTR